MALRPDILLTQTPVDGMKQIQGLENALLSFSDQDPASLAREQELLNIEATRGQNVERDQNNRLRSLALFAAASREWRYILLWHQC